MTTSAPAERSFYFGPPGHAMLGCLHEAHPVCADVGVVVCASFGREEINAHRTLRTIAERLAQAGVPVLRYDAPGTGDSPGDAADAEAVQRWHDAVGLACAALRAHTGVAKIVLLGHRLGALLAMRAAVARDDIAAFVALAPLASGRAFVRETAMLGRLGDDGASLDPQAASAVPVRRGADGTIESGGFVLAAPLADTLRALEPADAAPASRILVVDRDDLAPSDRLVRRWRDAGAQVDHRRLPGYAGMMLDPEFHVPPVAIISSVTDWVVGTVRAIGHPGRGHACDPPAGIECAPVALSTDLRECVLTLDPAGTSLSAVVTFCDAGQADADETYVAVATRRIGRVLVVLNAGATRRIGPGRLHVRLARHMASAGWAVVRLDMPGLGDSARAAPADDDAPGTVYPRQAIAQLVRAIEWMRRHWRVRELRVTGVCSGAYHAWQLAAAGAPVDGVVPINPLTFDPDADARARMPAYLAVNVARSVRAMSRARWKALLRGDVDPRRIALALGERALQHVAGWARELARMLHLPLRRDLASELRDVTARGVAVRFVFSVGDPGHALLMQQGGSAARRLLARGALAIDLVPDATHIFDARDSKDRLCELLARVLESRPNPASVLPDSEPSPAAAAADKVQVT